MKKCRNFNQQRDKVKQRTGARGAWHDLQSNSSLRGEKTGKTERNAESLIPTCSPCEANSAQGTTVSRNRIKSWNIRFPANISPARESPEIRSRFSDMNCVRSKKRSTMSFPSQYRLYTHLRARFTPSWSHRMHWEISTNYLRNDLGLIPEFNEQYTRCTATML